MPARGTKRQQRSLDEVVQAFTIPGADTFRCLLELVDLIRPDDPDDAATPAHTLQQLSTLLTSQPQLRTAFRSAMLDFPATRRSVSFYADTGVAPNQGFISESLRRISRSLLPDAPDQDYLKDVIRAVFNHSSDAQWISAVPDELWCGLFASLHLEEVGAEMLDSILLVDIYEALRINSYRIAAFGVEPELVRIEPQLEQFESPFLAQNPEMLHYLDDFREWWQREGAPRQDPGQLSVLFDQCREVIERVRTRASQQGTSLSLTLLLQRLDQHLTRCDELIAILQAFSQRCAISDAFPPLITLTKRLIADEARSNDVRNFWRSNLDLLARRVTAYADHTGEHYITRDLSEYFALIRSAAVGGVILAFMALFKLYITAMHLPPLSEALLVCLNYGLGFVFIHIVHGTVATKQPAMTAATIAAGIDRSGTRQHHLDQIALVVARTTRSQLAAIFGNVIAAVPTAILLGTLLTLAYGYPYPGVGKAQHLIEEVHPWHSGSLLFAAITGVCLFLTGLISGYYDNLAAYYRIPQRLMLLGAPRRLLGEQRWQRICDYIDHHLGALAGNFFFGFLLGGVIALGVLFGLPLDIRHIAFSSAFVGFSLNTLDYALTWREIIITAIGVLLIGVVNLVVSFTLSLRVAYRALGIALPRWALLLRTLRLFARHPRDFFFPPRTPAGRSEKHQDG